MSLETDYPDIRNFPLKWFSLYDIAMMLKEYHAAIDLSYFLEYSYISCKGDLIENRTASKYATWLKKESPLIPNNLKEFIINTHIEKYPNEDYQYILKKELKKQEEGLDKELSSTSPSSYQTDEEMLLDKDDIYLIRKAVIRQIITPTPPDANILNTVEYLRSLQEGLEKEITARQKKIKIINYLIQMKEINERI